MDYRSTYRALIERQWTDPGGPARWLAKRIMRANAEVGRNANWERLLQATKDWLEAYERTMPDPETDHD